MDQTSFRLETPAGLEETASEKLRLLLVGPGATDSIETIRDLAILLGTDGFSAQELRNAWIDSDHAERAPLSTAPLVALAANLGGSNIEWLWQNRILPASRKADQSLRSGLATSLRQTLARIIVRLEKDGICPAGQESRAAAAVLDLGKATDKLDDEGLTPVGSARFASALKAFHAGWVSVDTFAAELRWAGMAEDVGMAGVPAAAILQRAMKTAGRYQILPAIDRGWNRGRGDGLQAIAALVEAIAEGGQKPPAAVERPAAPKVPAVTAPRPRRYVPAVQEKPARRMDANQMMRDGVTLLQESRPATHHWFMGLANVLASVGAQVPDTSGLTVEMPDDARAPFVWVHIARRKRLDEDLEQSVSLVREILGIEAAHLPMHR